MSPPDDGPRQSVGATTVTATSDGSMHRAYLKAKVSDVESGGEVAPPDPDAADALPPTKPHDGAAAAASAASPAKAAPLPHGNAQLASYTAVFFLSMVMHEIALEAAATSFSHLDALTSAVTLFQFGFCFLLPVLVSGPSGVRETFPKTASGLAPYVRLSVVVFGATALATKSLNYVSYPTKVVFKSAKLIPTMIVSTIVNKSSRYGTIDYLSAALLCVGAAGYSYGSGSTDGRESSSSMGILLLTASVVCDALVPNLQQNLMAPPEPEKDVGKDQGGSGGKGLSAAALMVNVNAVGFGGLLCYMVLSGSFSSSVQAALASPMLLLYLSLVGIGLSTAVLAYTRLIREAGSVVAVAMATLRKVATVVLSYVVFPKPLLPVHVLSGLLVLAGVLLSTYVRQRGSASSSTSPSR